MSSCLAALPERADVWGHSESLSVQRAPIRVYEMAVLWCCARPVIGLAHLQSIQLLSKNGPCIISIKQI